MSESSELAHKAATSSDDDDSDTEPDTKRESQRGDDATSENESVEAQGKLPAAGACGSAAGATASEPTGAARNVMVVDVVIHRPADNKKTQHVDTAAASSKPAHLPATADVPTPGGDDDMVFAETAEELERMFPIDSAHAALMAELNWIPEEPVTREEYEALRVQRINRVYYEGRLPLKLVDRQLAKHRPPLFSVDDDAWRKPKQRTPLPGGDASRRNRVIPMYGPPYKLHFSDDDDNDDVDCADERTLLLPGYGAPSRVTKSRLARALARPPGRVRRRYCYHGDRPQYWHPLQQRWRVWQSVFGVVIVCVLLFCLGLDQWSETTGA